MIAFDSLALVALWFSLFCANSWAQVVPPTKPKLMTSVSSNFSIEYPMAYGTAGLADGDDLVYFCGGRNQTVVTNQCSVFSPKNCLTNQSPCSITYTMSARRWGLGGIRAFQKLWLVGGFTQPDWNARGSATDLIEAATRMSIKAETEKLSAPRGFILMLALNDRVYAIGGLSDCCQLGNIDVYRGVKWFQSATMLALPRGDACGGFLEGSGGLSAIVIGGRKLDGSATDVIEIIGPDDRVQSGMLFLEEARYGCVATTAPDRKSITVMGGIGKRSTAMTQVMLSSVEIVTAAKAMMTLAPMPNGVASHMALVEAPPFVFVVGGNSLFTSTAVLASDFPPTKQRPINTINVFGRDDRMFATDTVLLLQTARSFAAAALIVDDVDRYVIVAGGFSTMNANTTVSKANSIEIINFQIGTRAPTPMPTSSNQMSTTRPPTPLPTPQPTPESVDQEPTAAPCSGIDCAVCVSQPRTGPKYCGFNYGAEIFSEDQGQLVARLCEIANLQPVPADAGALMGMDATCEEAFFAPENQECLIAYQQLTCTFYCQECTIGVSPTGLLKPCDRYCQNLRSVCKNMYDIGCQLKVDQIPCARTDEPCARLLPYDLKGEVVPLGGSDNVVAIGAGVAAGVCVLLVLVVGGFIWYRRSQGAVSSDGVVMAKNKNTNDAPLKCPHCTNSYYFDSDLTTHIEKRHASLPPDSSAVVATEGGVVFSQYGKTPAPPPNFNGGGPSGMFQTANSQMFLPVQSGPGVARPGRGGKTQMDRMPTFGQSTYPLARALYDCFAEEPDELSFKGGDVLEIVDMSNPDWWVARHQGTYDNRNIPVNYVQLM